ncbi:DNA/RNA nuclease SfsA [Bacillota bacterium LX-D]|nr:DNA/RNA nuclease SfsA [Bacillota bacterium LX-D]
MQYEEIEKGIFLQRPNRFIAQVLVNGKEETVHVKNTGRCKEILLPKTAVILEKAQNQGRKTDFSLISAYKNNILINIDSQVPNKVVFDGIREGKVAELREVNFLKREVTYAKSRFDLYFETKSAKGFVEVKGVTLENNGVAMFPDAPTERGAKHVTELSKAVQDGYDCFIFFLIQMQGVKYFTPNKETDLAFCQALYAAEQAGVKVLCYDSIVMENSITLGTNVPIKL